MPRTINNARIDAALKVLQTAEMVEKMESGNVDTAVKLLVQNATDEFGFAPRDVYNGVFNLPVTKANHTTGVKNLNYDQLKAIAEKFSQDHGLVSEFPHRVIVVSPYPSPEGNDDWTMDFKTPRIGKEVVQSMRLAKDKHLREMYDHLHKLPETAIMAGWVFEAIVHRMFTHGWPKSRGPVPEPIPMGSKGSESDSPLFSTARSSSSGGPPPRPPTSLRAKARDSTRVDFAASELSDVTLVNNRYYTPAAINSTLFDSFSIDHTPGELHATISILQITTSRTQGGSAEGYHLIRRIVARVHQLLEEAAAGRTRKPRAAKKPKVEVEVKVVYFLVCPQHEAQRTWKMPVGWDKTGDHRGNVFCIPIPTPVKPS